MPISLQAADQFLSFAISIGSMQISKHAFMSSPSTLLYLRVAFAISVFLQTLAALYIKNRIAKQNNRTTFRVKPEASLFSMADTPVEEIEISVHDYDMEEANKMLRGCLLQSCIITLVHWKWSVMQPILIQSTAFIRNLLFNSLYYAYLYGLHVERPFDKNILFTFKKPAPTEETTASQKKKED